MLLSLRASVSGWLSLIALAALDPSLAQEDAAPEPPGAGVVEADACALCHAQSDAASAMRDAAGRGVAPFDLWRGTLMANSARDPFWRAVLSAEVEAAPTRRADVEAECLRCHAPLADRAGLEDHGTGSPAHVLECEGRIGSLARDGVSCVMCHGMSPEGLGSDASFSAGFHLDPWRRIFGPHADPFTRPMQVNTGYTPTQGEHVTSAALCGTCHTVVTHAFDSENATTEVAFHEQTPYLEWRNSIFVDEVERPGPHALPCQGCHVPTSDADGEGIQTLIAHHPGGLDFAMLEPRAPYGRHAFVGGNTLVLAMLADHAEELAVAAPRAALLATAEAARAQLEHRTARVAIEDVTAGGGRLAFRVRVDNLTGHKLPTGHPSRRMWLRVLVRDAAGTVLFASGEHDVAGRLIDAAGAPLPSELASGPEPPHRDRVTAPDEVALYRAVMADLEGAPTYRTVRGASWHVDDRILPRGWSAEHADAARTRPVGVDGDEDFSGGGDRVAFELALPGAARTIEVELLYQVVSARWVAELAGHDTPEVRRFVRYWEAADRTPVTLARARARLDG